MSQFRGRYQKPPTAETALQAVDKPTVIWYQSGQEPGAMQLAGQLGWLEQEFSPDAISCCALQVAGAMSGYATFGQGELTAVLQQQASDWQQGLPGRFLLGLIPSRRRWHLLLAPDKGGCSEAELGQMRFAVLTEPITAVVTDLPMQGWATEQLLAGLQACPALQSVSIAATELRNGLLYQRLMASDIDAVLLDQSQLQQLQHSAAAVAATLPDYELGPHQLALQLGSPCTVDSLFWRRYPQLVLRFLSRVLDTEDWAVRHLAASADYLALTSAGRAELQLSQSLGLPFQQLTALDSYKNYLFRQGRLTNDFALADWIEALPLQILRTEGGRQQVKTNRSRQPQLLQAIATLW